VNTHTEEIYWGEKNRFKVTFKPLGSMALMGMMPTTEFKSSTECGMFIELSS